MIEKLHNDSDELWNKSKKYALKCLENYLQEVYAGVDLQIGDFNFVKNKQSLIFWSDGYKTYLIRTTYNLSVKKENNILAGYYSLDVDENYEIIDDWLVFN